MKWTPQNLAARYQQINTDPSEALQRAVWQRLTVRKKEMPSWVKKLALACAFAVEIGLIVWYPWRGAEQHIHQPVIHQYPSAADFSQYQNDWGEILISHEKEN